jgi:iron complex transport system substrate-binding protein
MRQAVLVKVFYLLITVLLFDSLLFGFPAMAKESKTRIVTDNYGRRIEVPMEVKKIACMPGSSYEMVFMLGGKDQIGQIRKDHRRAYPLANLTNPDLVNYSSRLTNINPKARINIEEFIKAAPDVVIYYNVADAIRKFEEALIPVYIYQPNKKSKDFDDAIKGEKRTMRLFANLLGGKAASKAEKWCRYYDNKIELIRSRTADIPLNKRPRVYIGNSWGRNPLSTWAGNTMTFTIRVCGGICVTKDIKGAKFPEVNFEQILNWNPDVIIIDNHGREPGKVIENISKDPDWSVLNAVRNNRVHRIPSGVFFLDKGSSRPVYLLWLAKQLTPEKFADIDMVKEIKFYFKEFYQYDLSTEDAEHALRGWDANYEK